MALAYQIETLEGLDEGVAALYVEKDGKHVLDVEGVESAESVAGLKTALQKERENAASWKKYGTPADIDAQIAALTEKAKGSGKGADDAQAKLDALDSEYKAQIAERDARLQSMMKARTDADLKAELAKVGVVPEGLDMMAQFASTRVQFNDDGTPKVLTKDGKPMIGSGADHGATLSDLAKELAESMPYLVKDSGNAGGGKQPGSNGGTPKNAISRTAFDAMSPPERSGFLKSGGKVSEA